MPYRLTLPPMLHAGNDTAQRIAVSPIGKVPVIPVTPGTEKEMSRSPRSEVAPPSFPAMLADFSARGDLHEVCVPGLDVTLWLVPTPSDAATLMAQGISRGRIWTAAELKDFLSTDDRSPATWTAIIMAKVVMAGEITEVRRRGATRPRP